MKIPIYNYTRALMRLETTKEKSGDDFAGNVCFDVSEYYAVKEALEKQIPKKPECYIKTGDCFIYKCPQCHITYGQVTWCVKHCPNCGQALDWEQIKA